MRRLDLPCDRSHRDLLTKDLDSSGKIEGFNQTSSSYPSFKRSGGWGWGGDRPSHVTTRGNVTWGRARDRVRRGLGASARGSHVIGNQWECEEVGGEGWTTSTSRNVLREGTMEDPIWEATLDAGERAMLASIAGRQGRGAT